MTPRIANALEQLVEWSGIHLPDRGPIPLEQYFTMVGLTCYGYPNLTRRQIGTRLIECGVRTSIVMDDTPLAGYVISFQSGRTMIFFRSSDPIPRQRFTLAHELGHFLLHRDENQAVWIREESEVSDERIEASDLEPPAPGGRAETETVEQEREANQFAACLLVPESRVIRVLTPTREIPVPTHRYAVHQLMSECLVSYEMAHYRVQDVLKTSRIREESRRE
ncbi:ImmA/IrrE family metallo-endopeptidase [Tuwongella immobilis]|uniref:IrrE N-terminal-like domain-containing protein n=1 Tax=Tuwongella immobilis TaxID=692036 RepID=A0A6C2YL37_9BACT|nr:ImmA/IrrE family metallo-endopeptidase [Tuwongella immobilis]VIP01632.1 Putative toxin-antitoxin system, toxin component OS=Marvinbryantia formatexigens DSM 14469 GN=BRYFOR_09763 PE=4 SV=1: DUF955 [Tuwongella immobilis]VTR98984.1 Putative toxin-antitoxin system, toxin component OS=Marvinbryantia formatexigens DSM 14469 GN=BRYFOR_09763 PE=4 SV=1: DUF955 [Tuwongella immobilis]